MRRLIAFALFCALFSGPFAKAWENPLVNVSTPVSQKVKAEDPFDSSSSNWLSTKVRKPKKKRYEQQAEEAMNPNAKGSSSFSASFGSDYTAGFVKDNDPVATLSMGLNYSFNKIYGVGVSQSFSKLFYVYAGEREVQADDTAFMARARLYVAPKVVSISQSFSATAPTSETSRQYEIMSRVSESTTFSIVIVDKVLNMSLSPGASYTFNRFSTSPVSSDGGGRPLQQSTIGLSGSLSLQLTDIWDVAGTAGYRRIFYEKVPYENETSDMGLTNPPNYAYSLSLGTSVTLFNSLNVSLSVAQADRVEKAGGVEIVVYDKMATLWSAGLTYTF